VISPTHKPVKLHPEAQAEWQNDTES
jgi:hypothetical protein